MPNKNDHDTLMEIKIDVGYIREKLDSVVEKSATSVKRIDSLESFRDRVFGGFGVFALIVGVIIAKIMNLF